MAHLKTWQKICIRQKLQFYRAEEGNGDDDPLPISHLQERLKEFATPQSAKITMKTTWTVVDEALRRFAVGPKKPKDRPNFPSDDRLRVIADFLIDEGYMDEEDIRPTSKDLGSRFMEWYQERHTIKVPEARNIQALKIFAARRIQPINLLGGSQLYSR